MAERPREAWEVSIKYQRYSQHVHKIAFSGHPLCALAVAARGQGAPGQMTWLKGFRPDHAVT